jgi:hypothetical protein
VSGQEEKLSKLVEIMAIIGPLIAGKNLSKFSRDSADLAILQGESPQTLQSTKNKLTQWPPRF